jgi:hypothetical protein
MKTEHLVLLGIGLYWLYSRSSTGAGAAGPITYPTTPSRATGSGGTTASGGGGPIGGAGSNASGGPSSGSPGSSGGYTFCADGTMVNDPSLCTGTAGYTCPDGTLVNDASLCTSSPDTMDPCDPNSSAYDPNQCGSSIGSTGYTYTDTYDPCDPNSSAYDPSQCGSGYL